MEKVLTYEIRSSEEGRLLRSILQNALRLSATQIKSAKFREMGITVNGGHATVRRVVHTGDRVCVVLEEEKTASINLVPAEGTLDIVYEDEDMLLVNKPAGMPVHPSPGHYNDTLANILLGHFEKQGHGFVVRTLGRLDRSTSGLLLVAKNARAQTILEKQRAEGIMHRRYLAVVEGIPEPREGRIDVPIGPVEGSLMKRCVRADGQQAVTDYRVLESFDRRSLVELLLHTGRTHQIRVHMAFIGHPLVGDFLYGTEGGGISRAALHCAGLTFCHPEDGRKMEFTLACPPDMQALWEKRNG